MTTQSQNNYSQQPVGAFDRAVRAMVDRLGLGIDVAAPVDSRTLSFVEYVSLVRPQFQWYRHAVVLGAQLQRVADDELKRLMVFEPPRTGEV